MKHSVTHSLGKDMACKVAKAAFDAYVKRFAEYGAHATWTSAERAKIGFKVKGMALDGAVEVRDGAIEVDMEVPFLLRPFQSMALGKIDEEIRGWIAKAQRGEIA
jgi:hypothetical protein